MPFGYGTVVVRARERSVNRLNNSNLHNDLHQHVCGLHRYARALSRDEDVARDLVQECLTQALANAHRFRPDSNLRAWLYTILRNLYISRIRRIRAAPTEISISEVAAQLARPSEQISKLEFADLLTALDRIDDDQREALILISVEGLSYKEAADILGVPVGTVTSRLSRGREALRQLLGDGESGLKTVRR